MSELCFSENFLAWARRAGFSVTEGKPDYLAVLWNRGGETRYYIRNSLNEVGWYVVSSASRAEDEFFKFGASSAEVVERYFWGIFGVNARNIERLPRLRLPTRQSQLKPGYRIIGPIDEHLHLVDPTGQHIMTALDDVNDIALLVKMSHWLSATTADLEASFLDPGGMPLFPIAD